MSADLLTGATAGGKTLHRTSGLSSSDGDALVIGLVNNMPDAELDSTEKQFRELLDTASCGLPIRLRLFAVPEVPRSDAGRARILERYSDVAALANEHLDGLIVTGTEPRARSLVEEPFWPRLTSLVDWAQEHTRSTIWSCLAAHMAVLYLDGIERRPYPHKLSGIFACEKAADHASVAGRPSYWFAPHSRHNGIPEDKLVARGYRILSRSPEAGPDTFLRQNRSLFLFVQGHPEYDRHALHREYRRDVRRFLRGQSERYPEIPVQYFDAGTTRLLEEFRELALRKRSADLIDQLPAISDAAIVHSWHEGAIALYRGWLTYLYAERSQTRLRPSHFGAMAGTA